MIKYRRKCTVILCIAILTLGLTGCEEQEFVEKEESINKIETNNKKIKYWTGIAKFTSKIICSRRKI